MKGREAGTGLDSHAFGHEGHDLIVKHALVAVPVKAAGDQLNRHVIVFGLGKLLALRVGELPVVSKTLGNIVAEETIRLLLRRRGWPRYRTLGRRPLRDRASDLEVSCVLRTRTAISRRRATHSRNPRAARLSVSVVIWSSRRSDQESHESPGSPISARPGRMSNDPSGASVVKCR